MPLVTVNIPEKLGNSLLELLERGVVALERIAGPVVSYRPPVQAGMNDYSVVTPEAADYIKKAEEEFALQHLVVPGSPAYLAAVEEFERQVAAAYGDEAVEKLPWRLHLTGVNQTPPEPG